MKNNQRQRIGIIILVLVSLGFCWQIWNEAKRNYSSEKFIPGKGVEIMQKGKTSLAELEAAYGFKLVSPEGYLESGGDDEDVTYFYKPIENTSLVSNFNVKAMPTDQINYGFVGGGHLSFDRTTGTCKYTSRVNAVENEHQNYVINGNYYCMHSGADEARGTVSYMFIRPDLEYTIVITTNYDELKGLRSAQLDEIAKGFRFTK